MIYQCRFFIHVLFTLCSSRILKNILIGLTWRVSKMMCWMILSWWCRRRMQGGLGLCPFSIITSVFISILYRYTKINTPHPTSSPQWYYSYLYTQTVYDTSQESSATSPNKWKTKISSEWWMMNSIAKLSPYHPHHRRRIFLNCWMHRDTKLLISGVRFVSLLCACHSICTGTRLSLLRSGCLSKRPNCKISHATMFSLCWSFLLYQ